MSAQPTFEPLNAQLAAAETGMSREWRAFWRSPLAIAGVAILGFLILFSWVGPMIWRLNPISTDLSYIISPPFAGHPLGTTGVGQDQLSQLMVGGQISLLIGFFSAVTGMVIGVVYGLISAQFGGWLDTVLMRFVDMTLAIPGIYLLLVLDSILQPNAMTIIFIIAVTSWQPIARIVRGEVLSLKTRDFVEAARAEGAGQARIMFRHYLPNVMGPIIVFTTFQVGLGILTIAGLSFLGLGLPQTTPNWGTSLSNSMSYMYQNAWWLIYPPGILIVLAELSVNFLGDAFNSAFDPRMRGRG